MWFILYNMAALWTWMVVDNSACSTFNIPRCTQVCKSWKNHCFIESLHHRRKPFILQVHVALFKSTSISFFPKKYWSRWPKTWSKRKYWWIIKSCNMETNPLSHQICTCHQAPTYTDPLSVPHPILAWIFLSPTYMRAVNQLKKNQPAYHWHMGGETGASGGKKISHGRTWKFHPTSPRWRSNPRQWDSSINVCTTLLHQRMSYIVFILHVWYWFID